MKAVGNEKVCATCRETKHLSEFHKNRHRPDGLHSDCKECVSAANKAWRRANPDKKRQQKKSPRALAWAVGQYGLTVDQYEAMVAAQGGACAICGGPPSDGKRWHIDHDHSCCPKGRSCGQCVRGLLCAHCNWGLGWFRDNKDFLARAISYLGE